MNPNYYVKQKERALSRKLELIKLKGGKCEKCGYDKNISALEFHHLDPNAKKFNLDSRNLSNTTRDKILEELDKCILVCANCHRELHNPKFDNENIDNLLAEMESKHVSVFSKKKKHLCKHCGKEFDYTTGKLYCYKKCRDASINEKYPPYEKLMDKYGELKSWEKVAKYFGITRRIIQRLRKLNE
jgi:hypothetical protein